MYRIVVRSSLRVMRVRLARSRAFDAMRVLVATDARHHQIDGVTDTDGIVRRDVLAGSSIAVLGRNLRQACLDVSRSACRAFALRHSRERRMNPCTSLTLIRGHRPSRSAATA